MGHKKKEETILDLDPRRITIPRRQTYAVYRSPETKAVHVFPVVLWGIFEVVERDGDDSDADGNMIHGLVSQLGGLFIAEEVDDLVFIGYWQKEDQPDLESFLSDHESLARSGRIDDDPESDEADDGEEEEEEEEDEDEADDE